MIQSKKQWLVRQPDEQLVKQLEQELSISTIAAKILAARGCTTVEQAKKLLTVDHERYYDPFLMHGMQEAVERIEEALENGQKILIYGDYDSGATRF